MGAGNGYIRSSDVNMSVNAMEAELRGEKSISQITMKDLEFIGLPLSIGKGRIFIKEMLAGIVHHTGKSYYKKRYYDLSELKYQIQIMNEEEGGVQGYIDYLEL